MPEASRTTSDIAPDSEAPAGWKHRLRTLDRLLSRKASSPRVRNILLVVSLVAFVAIAVVSYLALPDGIEIRWWLTIPLVFASAPLNMACNAGEYMVLARMSGSHPRAVESLRLSLIATAANLLPIPGSVMIRTQALRADGVSYKKAIGASVIGGGSWIGVGAAATGVLLLTSSRTWWIGAILLVVATVALVAVYLLVRRLRPVDIKRLYALLVLVKVLLVAVATFRMFLSFSVLGLSIGLTAAVALTTPAILAATIGIFPAGLGLREVLAGLIGLVVEVPVAQSVVATAADRVGSQVGLAIIAGIMLLIGGRAVFRAVPAAPPTGDEAPRDPVRVIADGRTAVDLAEDGDGSAGRGQPVGRHERHALPADDDA